MAITLNPQQVVVAGYMALNFFTSVVIIWANKIAMQEGFKWVISLTALHFVFTFVGLDICARRGMFERKSLPLSGVFPISAAFCGFVVFNNLSLQYNAVGMYQLMKVMTTPCIVAIQYFAYNTSLPLMHGVALVPVCIGVILATVSSLDANFWGTVWGLAGIASTSVYQIWVKTQQENLKCNSQQLLYYQAPMSCAMLLVIIPFIEQMTGPTGLMSFEWTPSVFFWVFFSAFLAFLVNLSIFLVIGKTSPVSYNVLGHGKLCVILISGYTLFGDSFSLKNLIGVCMAFSGIVWYTHLKLQPASQPPTKSIASIEEAGKTEMKEIGSSPKE
jgi:solute carrier family 35 protein E3